jgi:hypothetical protein
VAGLSPQRRVVIVLRYGMGHTPKAIAELLGLPVGTIHSRLARGLDGAMLHKWFDLSWNGWESLGGSVARSAHAPSFQRSSVGNSPASTFIASPLGPGSCARAAAPVRRNPKANARRSIRSMVSPAPARVRHDPGSDGTDPGAPSEAGHSAKGSSSRRSARAGHATRMPQRGKKQRKRSPRARPAWQEARRYRARGLSADALFACASAPCSGWRAGHATRLEVQFAIAPS